ncbi:hypothetical protein ACFWIQ_09540 [Kitasatospora sp. NPDC127059]|uniref:hypothetical protein n=1 Tax=unclassified Kitasatospora TaxID=2633591 RepID=UPI003658A810
MTTQQTSEQASVDVSGLPADAFSPSDRARIQLGSSIASRASQLEGMALLLGDDVAVAGDYIARACVIQRSYEDVIKLAVIAERVRGTSWERIGKEFFTTAEEAEKRWSAAVEQWEAETKASSIYVREPGRYVARVDEFITTGRAYQPSTVGRRPLSHSLDAAAPTTGRDVPAADRAFAGTQACTHCHR